MSFCKNFFCIFTFAFLFSTFESNLMAAPNLFVKSYALVVGIGEYEDSSTWPSLQHGKKDAVAISEVLEKQGYEVTLLLGRMATREDILWTLSNEIAPKLTGHDRVVVYFSGHGETREVGWRDFGYIVPYDGTDRFPTWISMAEMREISEHMLKARHQLFIFDSCYGGSFGQKGATLGKLEQAPRYIEKISSNRARQFITAGGKGEIVRANGPHGYSYFTGYLIDALSGKADFNDDTYVTMGELSSFLLSAASTWEHTPRWGALPEHEQGEFWFRTTYNAQSDWSVARFSSEILERVFNKISVVEQNEPEFLTHPQGPIDDLTAIPGVDNKIQANLYRVGVFHYWQIAEWAEKELAWINENLSFVDSSVNESWIAKAKILKKQGSRF